MKKKAKEKKLLKIIAALVAVALIGGGVWHIAVRIQSKKYNLISLDTSSLPTPLSAPDEETDIELSDFTMHYVKYGSGDKSVILIHGNGSSHKRLEEIATYLGNYYTVYIPDSRCHGESTDPGVISYKLMAKDTAEFIDKLGLDKPYIMGHSDGGIIALTFASMYPDKCAGIISCGANSNPKTFKPYATLSIIIDNFFKPDKLNDMMLTLPDFTEEDFSKIKVPTYIVAAEFDMMWLSDNVYIHESIPQSKIAIIKMGNHSSYMSMNGKQGFVLAMKCLSEFEGKENA